MRSIIVGFLLGYIIFLLAVFSQIGAPTESSRWIYEIYTIKSRIANSIKAPKLVVVAGSNALFGISCKMLHEETGIPCVNGSTHAGLGIDYILNRAYSLIKPGDVVLLSLEYGLYLDNGTPTYQVVDYVFSRDPQYLLSLNLITQTRFITGISEQRLIQGITAKFTPPHPIQSGYQSRTLNEYGDETNNRQADMTEKQNEILNRVKPLGLAGDSMTNYAKERIINFIKWCRKNQIKIVATWPNTIWFDDYREKSKQEFLQKLGEFYREQGISILGKPTDFMYDKSMFFDTNYHLNDKGVRYRTKTLINLLRPYLEIKIQ
ncbi:MAG: hypothetical protein AB1589_06765 [Cyanobacteriota bacterium]